MPRRSARLRSATSSQEENAENVVLPHPQGNNTTDDDAGSAGTEKEGEEARTHQEVSSSSSDDEDDDSDEESTTTRVFLFQGVEYKSYLEMVYAKRKRNHDVLEASGLLSMPTLMRGRKKQGDEVGLLSSKNKHRKKQKTNASSPELLPKRKSNRIAGLESDGKYVDREQSGRFSIASSSSTSPTTTTGARRVSGATTTMEEEPEFYRNRINNGSSLSVQEAVEHIGDKWMQHDSVGAAQRLVRDTLGPLVVPEEENASQTTSNSRRSMDSPRSTSAAAAAAKSHSSSSRLLNSMSVESVAKVTPDRIYGIATHPSPDQLIVCAGDKSGYVGIWNVDKQNNNNYTTSTTSAAGHDDNHVEEEDDGVHLFRFHTGAASCLQWTRDGSSLLSASYDGTVRLLNVQSEQFEQVFGTFDSQVSHKHELGYKMDTGYRFWTQYVCLDDRFQSCFFLSTSIGTAMHVDLRTKGRVTFHEQLSEKKINTLSLHPNGHSLLSAGLDCSVKLWDVRKFRDNRRATTSMSRPLSELASYNGGRSVNSAFFSPSGRYVVSTTMANKLDLFENMHFAAEKSSSSSHFKPSRSIRHDNMTGRWLSTFMAQWHPSLDYFVVGSMRKPRCVEVYDGSSSNGNGSCTTLTGEALTAVASRCCFHPSSSKITIVGGNSSGRVTVIR